MEYNYTVHPDSEHETKEGEDNKVVATVAVTFDNPAYEPEHTERVTSPVMQFDDNEEILRDKNGDPVYEDVEQDQVVPAKGKKQVTFVQDIFVTAVEKDQDAAVKEYCEQYEKDYNAQFSQK